MSPLSCKIILNESKIKSVSCKETVTACFESTILAHPRYKKLSISRMSKGATCRPLHNDSPQHELTVRRKHLSTILDLYLISSLNDNCPVTREYSCGALMSENVISEKQLSLNLLFLMNTHHALNGLDRCFC